jgi:murein DD-endopeptidase MepM/ murein hydrolase activator NlpD
MLMTIVNRHSDLIIIYLSLASVLLSNGCASPHGIQPNPAQPPHSNANVFDEYMNAEAPPADGFDFPIGDPDAEGIYTDKATGKQHNGWYVATRFAEEYSLGIHPGEDWNGAGGGDTDLGQDVYAVANGRVVFAAHCGRLWGNVIIIEHTFYENHEKRKIRSLYAHLLEIKVQKGQDVRRRQLIATIGQDPDKLFKAHLHLELRLDETLSPTYWPSSDGKDVAWVTKHYAAPTEFIKGHRQLFVPQQESTLILVDQASYKMRIYEKGKRQGEYDVSFGQGKGQKRRQGDNRTPKGMYFVIHKHRGRFDGAYGKYYGGHWIKFNYPNKYDAAWGRANNVITPEQETKIGLNWEKRAQTLESTGLGGGIGFHGWISEWENNGPRHLSWGCVVMHLYDIRRLYDRIPKGAMVVVF